MARTRTSKKKHAWLGLNFANAAVLRRLLNFTLTTAGRNGVTLCLDKWHRFSCTSFLKTRMTFITVPQRGTTVYRALTWRASTGG